MNDLIVERFTASKSGVETDNEDRICVTDAFAAVVDGVTSQRLPGDAPSPVGLAADSVCRAIEQLPPDCGVRHAVQALSAAVRGVYAGTQQRPAAAVVLFSRARREIWSVGDCRYLAGTTRHEPELGVDRLMAELRSFVLHAELAQGRDVESLRRDDAGRDTIEPLMQRQRLFANAEAPSPWGYGVINGDCVPERLVHMFSVPQQVGWIVLASDGYPSIRPTLLGSEAALATIVRDDPLCIRLCVGTKAVAPGASAFDDRSYLRLRV